MRTLHAITFRWAVVLALTAASVASITPVHAISLQEEVELGKKIDVQILSEQPETNDKAALKEIDRVGQLIVKKGGLRRPEIEYHFRVLQGDDLNAFSTPGGYVYFTERMWDVLRPDERAGVLAHEIVHADRRHALDALSKLQRRSLILGALLAIVGANRTVGSVVDIANQLYTLKYSRGDERQADEVGVELLVNSNLNPAGLLLAMRKINRFQDEHGGRQPTILSTHPPTPDRLRYLEDDLRARNIPIPPEKIETKTSPHLVGTVTSVSGNRVEFTATKQLQPGDTVWLMAKGWDYYYENQTLVPAAKGVVSKYGNTSVATIYPTSSAKSGDIAKGAELYAPPGPESPAGVAKIIPAAVDGSGTGKLVSSGGQLKKFDRFLAVQSVWDEKQAKLVNDNSGYVVITDPSDHSGFVTATRPKYSYAPASAGAALVALRDPDASRWVGPIVSIGRNGQTIEVIPTRALDPNKVYEVAYPAWNKDDDYKSRVVGVARPAAPGKKIVLTMSRYNPGWSIANMEIGFDIYERPQEQK